MDHKKLNEYIDQYHSPLDPLLHKLERDTHLKTLAPQMLSGRTQGKLLEIISLMVQPRLIVEVGTFTGYATLCMAKGLQGDGHLYTIDPDKETSIMAQAYFDESPFNDRITLLNEDAMEAIPKLPNDIDLVFIDANKDAYISYYELLIPKVRTGGIILADNVLWYGKVWAEKKDKKTRILHEFNEIVSRDVRVESVIIPLRDGIHLARKK